MESDFDSDPHKLCSGCLTVGRKLHVLTDKTHIEMFSCLLDYIDIENHDIPLCYECMGRLNSIVRFRKQVKKAHRFLKRFTKSQATSMTRLSLTRAQRYEWTPQTARKLNQLPPNFKRPVGRPRKDTTSKVLNPECVIIIDDTQDVDIKPQLINTLMVKQQQVITPKNVPAKNPLNIEKNQLRTEKNRQDSNAVKSQIKFYANEIVKDVLNIENAPESDTTTNIIELEINTANIEKREFDVDETNMKIAQNESTIKDDTKQNDSTTWEVNVKKEQTTTINIKLEENDKETQDIKQEVIHYNGIEDDVNDDGVVEENRSEFSDSDDEPLNVKKNKKEEVKPKRKRRTGVVCDSKIEKHLKQLNLEAGHIERVILTWEEVDEERQRALTYNAYLQSVYKCSNCIMGFNHVLTYEAHMTKHTPEAGKFECDICKTRFKSQNSLVCHSRRHTSRWRCRHCGAVFSRAPVAADHVSRAHGAASATFTCRSCKCTFSTLSRYRTHMKSHNERQHCEQCGKTFKDKYLLKKHLFLHTNRKDFVCKICDKKFVHKRSLVSHMYTHGPSQNLYCAECNLTLKNPNSYYQHFKYTLKHVHPDDMKFACEFCPHKFARPRRLQEHRLSVHLKITPHQCKEEGCGFASASRASLRTHIRMVHKNHRLVKNHVCDTCGKAYSTKRSLEHHINSHTGHRPYSCTLCSAKFPQSSAVYNHIRLVHKAHFERQRKERQKKMLKNIVTNEEAEENQQSDIVEATENASET